MIRFALFLFLHLSLAASAWCDKVQDAGQRTFWDEIMEVQARRMLYQGAVYMERQQYEDAVREFAKAVISDPKNPNTHRMLGVAYYWSGQVDQAQAEFEESLKLDPANAQTHLLLGIVHAWKGDERKSYESFHQAAKLDPRRADISMNLGSIEEGLGMIPEALAHFRKAVDLDSSHPLYHFQLGMLYRRLGRDDEAIDELNEALKKYPDYQDAMLELGATYERTGKNKAALDMFRRAVRLKQRDSVARFRLARAYLMAGREKEARDTLREVFHLTPADRGQGLALALSYGGRSSEQGPDGDSPDQGGSTQARGSRAEPERAADDKELSSSAADVLARNLARIPLDQEAVLKVDMAFIPKPKIVRRKASEEPSLLKQALERAGAPPPASMLGAHREYTLSAGTVRERDAQIKKIIADIRGALAKAPADSQTRFGMNLNFSERSASARVAPDSGKPNVSFNPHDVGNDLGLWVMGTGWMGLVEEVLESPGSRAESESVMAHPDNPSWWVLEGIGQAIVGNSRRAMESFTRAVQLDSREELAYLGRGVALVISGDEAGAAEAYRRALAINPKNRTAAEGLKWLLRAPAK